MAKKAEEPAVKDSLLKLAGIEVHHKGRLYRLYATLDGSVQDQAVFESSIVSAAMEGGFTTEEFLERNTQTLQTDLDVIGMAMTIETQALDLYMRFSRRSGDQRSREVIHDLAEEEKTHLSTLGRLIEAGV